MTDLIHSNALEVTNCDIQMIEHLILTIRGELVILDRDLARLYNVETKRLNEQVKRNIERFPRGLHVSTYQRRGRMFKVAKCDLE